MALRTYYWNDSVISKAPLAVLKLLSSKRAGNRFHTGNSGDIMAEKIIEYIYNVPAKVSKDEGRRLLCIGSIAHRILNGDVVCGIGAKSTNIPLARDINCHVYGLRGPITYDLFKKAGHLVDHVKFLADPGLLLKKMMPDLNIKPKPGKVIFIPHYKERFFYKKPINGYIEIMDIDIDPIKLGNKILEAECILSSSLHGIIFSHALGRPCGFVLPQTDEPIIKYTDYFESVNVLDPKPLKNIYDYLPGSAISLPSCIDEKINSIQFPDISWLIKKGIV
ncbi:MAG: polysaccharide pyruvyl transferase family protein [Bacteroidota bacterium]